MEDWAEIRRLHRVEKLSKRAIARRLGLHQTTVTRVLESDEPPKYRRPARVSIPRGFLREARPWCRPPPVYMRMVLCYSRLLYVEFSVGTRLPDLLRCHHNGLRFVGSPSRCCAYANLSSVVTRRQRSVHDLDARI